MRHRQTIFIHKIALINLESKTLKLNTSSNNIYRTVKYNPQRLIAMSWYKFMTTSRNIKQFQFDWYLIEQQLVVREPGHNCHANNQGTRKRKYLLPQRRKYFTKKLIICKFLPFRQTQDNRSNNFSFFFAFGLVLTGPSHKRDRDMPNAYR